MIDTGLASSAERNVGTPAAAVTGASKTSTTRKAISLIAVAASQSGSVFVAGAIAAAGLPPEDYAKFSHFQAWLMFLAIVLDLGIGQTILRESAKRGDPDVFLVGLRLKLMVIVASSAIGITAAAVFNNAMIAMAVAGAAFMSANLTQRIYHNEKGHLRLVLAASAVMAVTAVGGTATALATAHWKIVAAAAFLVPAIAANVVGGLPVMRRSSLLTYRDDVRIIIRQAPYLFASGLLFATALPLVLIITRYRLEPVEFATFALALSFAGALSMLTNAFRVGGYTHFARLLSVTQPGLRRVLSLTRAARTCVAVYAVGSVAAAIVLWFAYETKYPSATVIFTVLTTGLGLTGWIGFYNIRHQVAGYRRLEIAVNFIRLAAILVLVSVAARSAAHAAIGLAATSVLAEIGYARVGDWHRARAKGRH